MPERLSLTIIRAREYNFIKITESSVEEEMFEIILFDLDGTLSDSGYGITRCAAAALSHFGIEREPDELTCFVGPPPTDLFQEKYGLSFEDAQTAMKIFRNRFAEKGILENRPYDGIPELLRDLHAAGRRIALATSKPRVYAKEILGRDGIDSYFELIMGSELNGDRVEKVEVIKEAIKQLNISDSKMDKVVMVGDRKYDILGARALGLRSIGVDYGYAEPNELKDAGADYCVPTVESLRALLLGE